MKTVKLILKFIWQYKESKLIRKILKKKSNVAGFILPDFKTYSTCTVIEMGLLLAGLPHRPMEQSEDSRNRFIVPAQLIFDKHAKVSQLGRMIFFNI